jgi:hypothetical protein
MQTPHAYVLTQATICAVINMIVNPAMSWVTNRGLEPTPLPGILIDTTITCLIMATAIAWFTIGGVRRGLRAGQIGPGDTGEEGAALRRLHKSWWALGLVLGAGFAIVLVPLTYAMFKAPAMEQVPFRQVVLFKVVYTGAMAFVVPRWVILHELRVARG